MTPYPPPLYQLNNPHLSLAKPAKTLSHFQLKTFFTHLHQLTPSCLNHPFSPNQRSPCLTISSKIQLPHPSSTMNTSLTHTGLHPNPIIANLTPPNTKPHKVLP
ncbi:hypothetical protein Csa_022762 [Cucumis sativus]|uniref:Uncharacterized protein n=1 Tax=Cucumis sativus TaxID=3659 RepID=A0A0A0LVK0_CUCSA|nr:hypothetical protein Csa_022762 [Cucumis sativus]